jgi:hypothetical protein
MIELMTEAGKNLCSLEELGSAYMTAKKAILECGYAFEIDWQDSLVFDRMTESDFLREAAWVVLSSGMSEFVIRRKFPQISAAFLYWKSASQIAQSGSECSEAALRHFKHFKKIESILKIALHVHEKGFEVVYECIKQGGVSYLSQFPYMGPATSRHLAKNIGLQVAKPDRHLNRISEQVGYGTAEEMCADISRIVGDKIPVVDLVLWRYATLHEDYLRLFPILDPVETVRRAFNSS